MRITVETYDGLGSVIELEVFDKPGAAGHVGSVRVYHEGWLCDRYFTGAHVGLMQIAGEALIRFAGYGPELQERKKAYEKAGIE